MLKPVGIEEKRISARQKLFLRGFIRTPPKHEVSIDCMVRDLSQVGAKLRFRCTPLITDFFELHIPGKGAVLQSKLVWMNNCEAGVSFDAITAVGAPPSGNDELSARMARLEDEITALKDMLKRLQGQFDKAEVA